jgi:hypothetical protein
MKHTETVAPAAAALSALMTLVCCFPAGLAAAGATAAIGGLIAPYQSWFLCGSVVLLGIGLVQVARGRHACATDRRVGYVSFALLCVSAIVVLMVTVFPQVVAGILADWMS